MATTKKWRSISQLKSPAVGPHDIDPVPLHCKGVVPADDARHSFSNTGGLDYPARRATFVETIGRGEYCGVFSRPIIKYRSNRCRDLIELPSLKAFRPFLSLSWCCSLCDDRGKEIRQGLW